MRNVYDAITIFIIHIVTRTKLIASETERYGKPTKLPQRHMTEKIINAAKWRHCFQTVIKADKVKQCDNNLDVVTSVIIILLTV